MGRRPDRGFSLVEVVVTLFIVGMVSGTLVMIWGNAFRGRSWAFKKDYHAAAMSVAMRQIQSDLAKSSRLDIDPALSDMSGNTGKWLRGAINIDQDGCFPTTNVDTIGKPTWYWYCITDGAVNPDYNQTEYELFRYSYELSSGYTDCPRRLVRASDNTVDKNLTLPTFGEADDPLAITPNQWYPAMVSCGTEMTYGGNTVTPVKLLGSLTTAYFLMDKNYGKGQVAVKMQVYRPSSSAGAGKPVIEAVDVRLRVNVNNSEEMN